jgi:hypothetical protein
MMFRIKCFGVKYYSYTVNGPKTEAGTETHFHGYTNDPAEAWITDFREEAEEVIAELGLPGAEIEEF